MPALLSLFRRCLLLLVLATLPHGLWAAEPTCTETSDRVLKPFLDRLQAAQDGLAHHSEQSAKRSAEITKLIADLRATRGLFDDKRAADQEYFAKRIAAAETAIADIKAAHAKRIAELEGAITAAAAVDNDREVDRLVQAMARENASFSAGKNSIHSPFLGFSGTTTSWREFITKDTARKSRNAADHAAGQIGLHLPLLGYTLNWQGVLDRIAKETDRLATTTARKDGFHLPSLGYTLNGEGIDALLAKRQGELADARARIAAGSFALHVPTFGYTTDRNGVQARMDKARAALAAIRAGWGNGTYAIHNTAAGYTLSKGDIDKKINDAETDLNDYIRAGDDATVHLLEMGYTTSGTAIRKHITDAKTAAEKSKWQAHYGHWQTARNARIDAKRAALAKLDHMLDVHRDLWVADIAARKEKIDGHFTRALAETPCGGSGSAAATSATDTTADTPATPTEIADRPPSITSLPPEPVLDPEDDVAWQTLKKRCTDLDTYRANQGKNLKVSTGEYMAYLRVLEKRNPSHSVRQIIARLHADFYGYDLKQTVPVIEAPLFLPGADTDGFKDVDPVCRVRVGTELKSFTPKFVYLPSGEEVDIAHLYAGPRSDMNRDDHNSLSLDMLLLANTWLGDFYQVYADSYTKFPHNQLRGDVLGIWMAQFYRLPRNRDVPLSVAMQQLLAQIGTAPGGYSHLKRPE